MRRHHAILLAGLLLGVAGCSEGYGSIHVQENTYFNELNDYLVMVVDEDSAKEFNNLHSKKIKARIESLASKLEAWEKLYGVDKDAMRPYNELNHCLGACKKLNISDMTVEELNAGGKGLSEPSLVGRLLRDAWANTRRFEGHMARIKAITALSVIKLQEEFRQAGKNDIVTEANFPELVKCFNHEPSKLLFMGQMKLGFFQAPQFSDEDRAKFPERIRPPPKKKQF